MGVVVLSTQYEPAGQTDSKAGVEQYMPLGQSKEERSFSFCAKEQEKGGGIMEERAISLVGYRLDLRPL